MESKELITGRAGEHLVMCDLLSKGYGCFMTEQGVGYDVVVDIDKRLIRIQVKTTNQFRPIPQKKKYTPAYLFQVRRCGRGGRRRYTDDDIDILALVVLNEKKIGYLPIYKVKTTLCLRSKDLEYKGNRGGIFIEDLSFEKAINELGK